MSTVATAILLSTTILSGTYAGGSSEIAVDMTDIDSCWKTIGVIQDTTSANATNVRVSRMQSGIVLQYGFEGKAIRRELSCISK